MSPWLTDFERPKNKKKANLIWPKDTKKKTKFAYIDNDKMKLLIKIFNHMQ